MTGPLLLYHDEVSVGTQSGSSGALICSTNGDTTSWRSPVITTVLSSSSYQSTVGTELRLSRRNGNSVPNANIHNGLWSCIQYNPIELGFADCTVEEEVSFTITYYVANRYICTYIRSYTESLIIELNI